MDKLNHWILCHFKKNQPVRNVTFPNYSRIRSVAVVFEQGTDDKQVAMLTKRLEKDGMIAETIGYEPKKDFTFLGKPHKQALAALPAQRFDLLLDLSTQYYIGTQYLVMAIDSTFKAGLRFQQIPEEDQQGILDMMVNLREGAQSEEIAEQVIHFMQMINQ